MKNIQAGFLTLPTLTRLPILPHIQDSGFLVKALTPKAWGRDYSGGSVPDFLTEVESRGSLYLDITVYIIPFNKIINSLSSFLFEPKKSPPLAGGDSPC